MAKLKKEYQKSKKIKVRFNSVGRFYTVSRERLCQLKDQGKLGKEFNSMFEPSEAQSKAISEAAAKAKAKAKADAAKEAKAKADKQ